MSQPVNELSDDALDVLIERERARVAAPLTTWASLSAQLREEGLLRDGPQSTGLTKEPVREFSKELPDTLRDRRVVARYGQGSWMRRAGQIAAGAALAAVGFVAGRGTVASPPDSETTPTAVATGAAATNTAPAFASLEDARAAMAQSQAQWQQAVNYLAANDSSQPVIVSPDEFHGRLQTLDQMMQIMQAALQEAPTDPVINQYYLSTFGARQATVQQLNQTLPVGARLAGF